MTTDASAVEQAAAVTGAVEGAAATWATTTGAGAVKQAAAAGEDAFVAGSCAVDSAAAVTGA